MTYAAAIQFLYGLQMFGARPGLQTPLRLAELAGHPERGLHFIHVAGTNGKGSTCAMLEGIYRAAGLRVGLFTSPHLVSFVERIQINRRMISADDVARLLTGMQPWLSQFPPEHHPTFFEVVTVLALRYFAEQQCDLVIWETGLGGRLDATNIVTPAACIITTIEHDHQQWLGETLEQIAMEKAGIIKPGAPVVTGAAPGRGLEVIQAAARDAGAPLTVVNEPDAVLAQFGRVLEIPLAGEHQRLNAALALSAVRVLLGRFPVDDSAARQGLATVRWPGRLQLVAQPGGRKLMLDGAHNPAGAAALRRAWEQQFPGVRPALILGLLRDKDWAGMAEILAPLAGRVLTVPVESARTLDPAVLAAACREVCPTALVEVSGSLADALGKVAHEPFVLIAGSLYLIGEALEELGLTPAPSADERGLNEWGALGGSRRPC